LMKGIQKMFKSPLYLFPWQLRHGKACPTDSDLFGLSRSTRCGCCSYQVSSISVRRVTCYDHFGVFQFVCILAVSMATAAILKKSTLKSMSTCYDIPTRFHKVWSRHLREIERTKMCGRRIIIIIIVKKKGRITIHHPTTNLHINRKHSYKISWSLQRIQFWSKLK
jgi:hypothetical protein